mgnify:CR=1 FL=1
MILTSANHLIGCRQEFSNKDKHSELRNYERWGLVVPQRSPGGTRYYSVVDIERIEKIKDWIDKFGINRAGIEIITELIKEISSLENKIKYLETELSRFKTRGINRELLESNRRNT